LFVVFAVLLHDGRGRSAHRASPQNSGGRPSDTVAVSSSKAGYSKNTVRLIRAALSTVLSDAVDDGYLATNPAFGAGRKRGKKAEALTQAERLQKIRPLSWKDRDALLSEAASDRRHSALFATLVKAGLRPGEGFALKPMDIDFKNQTLRVERAATDDGQVKDTKTHEARTVDLTPDLTGTLKPAPDVVASRGAPKRQRRARVAVPSGRRDPNEQGLRRRRLPQNPEAGGPPALPRVRPAAHLREPSARRERADHLRVGPAWALEPRHDHALLRPLDPEPG
jgi:integrase